MPSPRGLLALGLTTLAAGVSALRVLAAQSAPAAAAAAVNAAAASVRSAPADKSVFGWWELLLHSPRDAGMLLDPRWWAAYVAREFAAEPAHVVVEVACI